jgi:hypothetical protein
LLLDQYQIFLYPIVTGKNIFDMADRKLKIYHSYRSGDKKAVPEVRLIGKWLERSGFKIGEQVYITISDQEIIIKRLA